MPDWHVSFVIATHRRVDALRCTLGALQLQTHSDWTALVIGDHCGEETAETIRTFRDTRIRYYNLPERFGEQSGPNTAGLHLAEGDFISFLNHDDLLLADHLSYALDRLAAHDADFYMAKFANAKKLGTHTGRLVPVFTEILPHHDTLDVLLTADPWCFDPSSFWVIRTSYAKAVGPWRPAVSMWRTPLRDWLMRAWRRGGAFCFGDRLTGLRFWTQNLRKEGSLYAHATPEHEYMLERMQNESADAIRAFIEDQLARRGDSASPAPSLQTLPAGPAWWRACQRALHLNQRTLLSYLYLRYGIDPVNLIGRLSRRPRGGTLAWISRKRTGEELPARPTIGEFLRDPEAHRVF
jgi:hypothetical protein